MKKINPSSTQLVWFAATVVSMVALVLLVLFSMGADIKWPFLIVIPFSILITAKYVFAYVLKMYINKKVDALYSVVQQQKEINKKGKIKVVRKKDILEDVEKDVGKWIDDHKKEIDKYKTLSDYRRRFVGDLSHELKTPIFTTQSYLHTLIDGAIYDKKNNIKFLQKAINNVDRLEVIVKDLEIISRLESGELELSFQSFDCNQLIEEVFEELEIQAEERHIKLKFDKNTDTNVRVKADKEGIRRVLTNLILNSIKYGKKNGTTTVSVQKKPGVVTLKIMDNGIGIQKEHIRHVFGRFYRVDKSRSRKHGSSGLGLSIVKHIIEAHNQTITLESEFGKGSVFTFTLSPDESS